MFSGSGGANGADALVNCSEDRVCTFLFYVPTVWLYMLTLRLLDAHALRRKIDLHPPLIDLGFELCPRNDFCVKICDGIGLLGTALLVRWVFLLGPGIERTQACEALLLAAVGNILSTSLHSVTILPSDHFEVGVPVVGGGNSDKLMSNHTFNFGLLVRALARMGCIELWLVIPATLVYSLAMLSTRAHYTVDIILAWWALAAVHIWIDGAGASAGT